MLLLVLKLWRRKRSNRPPRLQLPAHRRYCLTAAVHCRKRFRRSVETASARSDRRLRRWSPAKCRVNARNLVARRKPCGVGCHVVLKSFFHTSCQAFRIRPATADRNPRIMDRWRDERYATWLADQSYAARTFFPRSVPFRFGGRPFVYSKQRRNSRSPRSVRCRLA